MMGVRDAVAVVTGAAQGNGQAIALGLAAAGAKLALADVKRDALAETETMVRAKGAEVIAAECDVADMAACRRFAQQVERDLGAAEILVNNAGIIRRHHPGDDTFERDWDEVFQVNVQGTRNMIVAFAGQLEATGGRIVNMASIMALTAGPGIAAYVASKGAVAQLTKAFAHEFATKGVRVNALAPGVIETPMTETTRANDAAISRFLAHTPLGRIGQPEELVGPVLFLCSDMSSYVTGAILPVDGGYLAA
jgi:NAD(P)-dependent dehydrogenase (short-subunit alcohol dehydrogenase family)